MPLESATYISDLVTTNPDGATDTKATLDDHIRLLKSSIKTTLPNVSGAVTASHTELNYVDGVTSAIQTQLDSKAPLASPTFTGTPVAPTAADGTNTTQLATTAYVVTRVAAAAMSATTPVVASDANKYWSNDGTTASWTPHKVTREARTSNTVLGAVDSGKFFDITSGTFSQTFAAAATLGSGWYCYIRNAGTGDITLDPNGAETIDGLTSFVMYPGEARLIQCDGTALRSVVLQPFAKTFTASGSFIKPPGYDSFGGLAWSGGAGGRSSGASSTVSSGGNGGGCFPFTLTATALASSTTVTIGAGGAGGAGGNVHGAAGGNTTFGSLLTVLGAENTAGNYGGSVAISGARVTSGTSVGSGFETPYTSSTSSPASVFGGSTVYTGSTMTNVSGGSVFGGAAGACLNGSAQANSPGVSVFGGSGGAASSAGVAANGSAPGGGGGATQTGTGGNGGRGELRIWGIA